MTTTQQPRNTQYLWLIMLWVVIIAVLASCSTAKELIDKAEKKDPAIVADYARQKYPCTDLLKPDTAVVFKDTTIYVDCPDTAQLPTQYEVIRFDTLRLPGQTKTIRVPVTLPIRTQTVTRWYEDSAKLKINQIQINNLQKDTAQLTESRDNWKGKAKHREKENWIWRAIATVLICWQVFKIYKRLTTIKVT